MFRKLFGRGKAVAGDSPLASSRGLDAVMAQLPAGDAGHRLIEAGEWLADVPELVTAHDFSTALRALMRLDEATLAARIGLLDRYLLSGTTDHSGNTLLDALGRHLDELLLAARILLDYRPARAEELHDKERTLLAAAAARLLRAWALHKRIGRFRYRPSPPALWDFAHQMLRLLAQWGVLQTPVVVYADEERSSPFREYLIGAYFETAPLGNLDPQQQEFLQRFLAAQPSFECAAQPAALSTHQVNISGNGPVQRFDATTDAATRAAAPVGAHRYLSVARLRPPLLKLAAAVRSARDVPAWVHAATISPAQIETLLQALLAHWAAEPPQRRSDRIDKALTLQAAFGFGNARRLVAATQFARSGRSLRYDILDPNQMFKLHGIGGAAVTPPAASEVEAPLEVLRKLESAGERAMMETWTQVDTSDGGMGVTFPAMLARHSIGTLIAVRAGDDLQWRVGIIRRIGRDAQGRPNLGLEMLAEPSLAAMVRTLAGETNRWSEMIEAGHGWSDGILVSEEAGEIILPRGAFHTDREIDVRTELGQQRIRLCELLDHGSDYERIRCEPV